MEGESDFRFWDELTPDALGLIFKNLELREVLQVIPLVCKSWCKVVEGPYCWQTIDIDEWSESNKDSPEKLDRMLRTLITRSSGSLRELRTSTVNDDMFRFIAEHAGSLQTLIIRRSTISDSTVAQAASKFSSLTTLGMSKFDLMSTKALEAVGRNCKNLVSLTWKRRFSPFTQNLSHSDEVRIIARNMPKLKQLTIANLVTVTPDFLELFSSCPELKSVDIRGCWDVTLDRQLLVGKYPKVKVIYRYNLTQRSEDSEDDWYHDSEDSEGDWYD